jgi:hypothetical protein
MQNVTAIGKIMKRYGYLMLFGCFLSGCIDKSGPVNPYVSGNSSFTIRVTEIHYNPADEGSIAGDSFEFIELKNVGPKPISFDGIEFVSGVDFIFPNGTTLQPGNFFVLASSATGFKKRYGFDPGGDYDGKLRNSGDTIELAHTSSIDALIFQSYSDTGSWPGSADGDGYSLVHINTNPDSGETGSDFWRASTKMHGSPGADDELKAVDSSLFDLRITEINYNPDYPDTVGVDSLEFIELKNIGTSVLDMGDVAITSGVDYKFASGATLKPGAFIVLASTTEWFKKRYGFAPFDFFEGQLKNSSESITLEDKKSATVLVSITYEDNNPWPGVADGDGWTLVPMRSNPTRAEQNVPSAWRQSFRVHGSPGSDDPEIILINEVLSHTDIPQVDAIELYNPNQVDVNIGGWFLSDEQANPIKFRIPENTIIKASDYLVFTANDFNKDTTSLTSFALSENGDEAYLSSDSTGCMGYCHGCSFGAMERGVSYGRYIIPSTGKEVFVPMADQTLGKPNTAPLVGPLVISEIMSQSAGGAGDYLEITNISNKQQELYDQQYPENTWRIQIDDQFFLFPKDKSIKSGESVVIICGLALQRVLSGLGS